MRRACRQSRRPKPTHRLPVVAGLLAVTVAAPGVAVAAQLSLTSDRLGATSLVPPPFHLTTVTGTQGGGGNNDRERPSSGDVLAVRLSQRISAASVCAGVTETFPRTFTGVTVDLLDGGAGPDTLRVSAGPAACPAPKTVTFTLGSTAYTTGAVIRFVGSSLTLANDSTTTSTISVSLGNPSQQAGRIREATVITATPDPALRDTSGRAISPGTAATSSMAQF